MNMQSYLKLQTLHAAINMAMKKDLLEVVTLNDLPAQISINDLPKIEQ